MEEMNELEQLREQMASLNRKLENEKIVTEELIKNTMSQRVSNINKDAIRVAAFAVIGMLCAPFSFYYSLHTSLLFVIVTEVFFVASIAYNYYCHRGLHTLDVAKRNLIETSLRLQRFKRLFLYWEIGGIPFIIIWGTWLVSEIMKSGESQEQICTFLLAAGIGGLLGLIIGLRIYFRVQRNASEVIKQIEEIQKCTE